MKCVVIEIENFTRQQLAGFVLIVGFPDSIVLSYFIRLSCSLPKLNPTKANLMNRFFSLLTIVFMTVTATAHAQISFGLPDGFAQSLVENPWDGSFAAGLNGKAGNSQNLDINLTLNLARETDVAKTTVLASYFYSANAISTVTDRFFGQARQERSFANRPKLSAFAQANTNGIVSRRSTIVWRCTAVWGTKCTSWMIAFLRFASVLVRPENSELWMLNGCRNCSSEPIGNDKSPKRSSCLQIWTSIPTFPTFPIFDLSPMPDWSLWLTRNGILTSECSCLIVTTVHLLPAIEKTISTTVWHLCLVSRIST